MMTGKSAKYENRNEKEERERNDNNKKVNNKEKKSFYYNKWQKYDSKIINNKQ